MSHSNRLRIHGTLVVIEIVLAAIAVVTAYLSEVGNWNWFAGVSAIALILYSVVKIAEAIPHARELLVREDIAAQMAGAAMEVGVTHLFNMQTAKDQAARNESTQKAIESARIMWLTANSGASYLDPGVYRHWSFIEKQLQAGIELRVAILDPTSPEKIFRNQLNVDGEQFDSKVNLASIIKIYNQYPTFDLRFVRSGMSVTVFATDQCLFVDPYHVGTIGGRIDNRTFCMRIEPSTPAQGRGLYQVFKSHFDTLWRTSISLEDWLASVNAGAGGSFPALKPRHIGRS